MTAGTYNLVIEQGATFRLRLTLQLSTNPVQLMDLTDHIARMQIRSKVSSEEVLLLLTTENGGITLGGLAGTVDLFISDEDTAALTFKSAVYDLEVEATPNGDVVRIIQGQVRLSPEVTR